MSFRQFRVILAALVVGRFCFLPHLEAQQIRTEAGDSRSIEETRPDRDAGQKHSGQATMTQLDYVLRPSDLIRVLIFQEPDLEREVSLSADSKISLPLVNEVDLKHKTIAEAQQIIHALYDKDFLVNPQVNITVLEYTKESVNVLGAVNNPGQVTIPPDQPLNLIDAITRAGGFSRVADRKHVRITRVGEDHGTSSVIVNADNIMQSANSDQQLLQKGDVIFVPERIL